MPMYLALLVVFGLFALGDFLGVFTKARMSSVFVALMAFLVLFLFDIIPPDIIDQANLTGLASMALSFLVFNMGTTINLTQMKNEWRVVLMAMLSMAIAIITVFALSPIIGRAEALVAIPIVNGGLASTDIMTSAALEKGFQHAAALGTLVFAVQKFVGTVPASRAGLSEARILAADFREKKAQGIDLNIEEKDSTKIEKIPFHVKHKKYYTDYMTLGIAALSLYVCYLLLQLTGLSMSIWALLIGMILNQLGLVPNGILSVGKSSGIWMVGSFASLIPSLATITFDQLASLSFQLVLIFGAVLIATYAIFYFLPTWKLVGSRNLAIGIGMSQLLGFPATFLIVNEVATAVSETDEEKDYIVKKLTPAFVVSGFVSVTTISIIIAGILSGLL